MIRPTVSYGAFFLGLVLSTLLSAREVRVGVYDFPPYCFMEKVSPGAKKQASGLFIDILEAIAREEHWELHYIPGTLEACIAGIAGNRLDLLPAIPFSAQHGAGISFTHKTVISTWAEIHTTTKREVHTLADLDSMVIGIMHDDPHNVAIRTLVAGLNIDCRFVEFNRYDEIAAAMDNMWIDAGVFDRLYAGHVPDGTRNRNYNLVFSPVELRFAVNTSADSVFGKTIDYRLTLLENDNTSVYHRQLEELFGTTRNAAGIPEWMKWAGGIGLALLLFFFLINLVLRTQIRLKTGELLQKNRELESEIAMRRSAEEDKNRSLEQLYTTIGSLRDAVIVSCDAEILHYNSVASAMFGIAAGTAVPPTAVSLLFDESGLERGTAEVLARIRQSGSYFAEHSLRRTDGIVFPAEVAVKPVGAIDGSEIAVIITVRDISEREQLKRSERMLRQAQKMEAIGTLAGGIAHDFNNILVPIFGYAQLIGAGCNNGNGPLKKYADQIALAAERARDLVKQIMTFSRQREKEVRQLNLSTIVKEALKLLRASAPATISITTDIATDGNTIRADPTHIHQVIMNLCTNAVYAMRERGGVLAVAIGHLSGSVEGNGINENVSQGEWVRLSVTDTGPGIDPTIIDRIFEPFYTTKPQSEGTGLGLAVVHGIVKDYGGAIHVDSTPGTGCRFTVYLPFASSAPEASPFSEPLPEAFRGDGARILYVDDEQFITDMATSMLTSMGYRVSGLTDAHAALRMFKGDPNGFDLIITDQTMPELTGKELSREMLACRADIPIIICTGYSETFSSEQALAMGVRYYLHKPFSRMEIGSVIRTVLSGTTVPAKSCGNA